jgi:hypothetical protein
MLDFFIGCLLSLPAAAGELFRSWRVDVEGGGSAFGVGCSMFGVCF